MVRTTPTHGISFGQKGYWTGKHYSSYPLAKAAYDAYLAKLRTVYGTPHAATKWTGRYVEEALDVAPTQGRLLEAVRFVPLTKGGKPGARVHTVHLYPITAEMAQAFLKDPFYCLEA